MRSLSSQRDIAGNIKDVVYYLLARTEYDDTKACNLFQKNIHPQRQKGVLARTDWYDGCAPSWEERVDLLKKAQELDSLDFNVLVWATRLLRERSHKLYYYDKIKSLYPDKYWDKILGGHIIEVHKGANFALTLSMINEYLQKKPVKQHHFGYWIRGTVNYELGHYEESVCRFFKMQELDEDKRLNDRIAL